jgi:hypothetical protein
MTNDKREQLQLLLADHAGEVIEAVIDGIAAAGSTPEWDSETIEYVMSPLQRLFEQLSVPNPGSAGVEDENTKYWCEVGGYDYEGEFTEEEDEPEPVTYAIHTEYIHMDEAAVTRGKYHGGGVALIAEAENDEGMTERETLSINLIAYMNIPDAGPNEVYVKDEVEHKGLAEALVVAGIAKYFGGTRKTARVTFGPASTVAYRLEISEEIQ